MSDRTTAGHPADSHRMSETLSTPCPSEGKQASKQADQASNNTRSSRGMALALVVESIRPDWSLTQTAQALAADDRPWTIVVQAAIRGALDKGVRHPNGLRYVGPGYGDQVTPMPPSFAEQRAELKCSHGAASGMCALCRAGVE